MKRRKFIAVLAGAAAMPLAARAQQPAMPVIGFFRSGEARKSILDTFSTVSTQSGHGHISDARAWLRKGGILTPAGSGGEALCSVPWCRVFHTGKIRLVKQYARPHLNLITGTAWPADD